MQTRREYAASLGLAQAGARGRLSREAHEAIALAEANGTKFSDSSPVRVNTPKPNTPKPVSVQQPVVTTGSVIGLFDKGELDQQWVGRDSKDKKHTVNARQVCRNSGYSLLGCRCGQDHSVLVSSMEYITVTKKGG